MQGVSKLGQEKSLLCSQNQVKIKKAHLLILNIMLWCPKILLYFELLNKVSQNQIEKNVGILQLNRNINSKLN